MCVTPHRFLWWVQVKTPSSNFPPFPPKQSTPLILPIIYLTSVDCSLARISVAFNHSTTFPNLQQAIATASHSLTNSHTLSLTHSFIHSLAHSLTHPFTPSLTPFLIHYLTLSIALTHLYTHSHTHSLTHSFTHPSFYALTIPLAHSLTYSLARLLAHCYVHYRLSPARPHSWMQSLTNCHKQIIRGPLHWNDC